MSMGTVARHTLYRQTRAQRTDRRALTNRALPQRIWELADRHHRRLGAFTAISMVSAVLAVATPLLAGKVVDQIGRGGSAGTVVRVAPVIVAVAPAERPCR